MSFPTPEEVKVAAFHKISTVPKLDPQPNVELWANMLTICNRDQWWDLMARILLREDAHLIQAGFTFCFNRLEGMDHLSPIIYSGLIIRNLGYLHESKSRNNSVRYLAFLFYLQTVWVLQGRRPSFSPEEYYDAP